MFNLDMIGIDAITLSNMEFKGFDGEKAREFINYINRVSFEDDTQVFNEISDYNTGELMKIKDMILNFYGPDLYPGLNQIRFKSYYFNKEYQHIRATLPTILNGNNLSNIATSEELSQAISILKSYCDKLGFKDYSISNTQIKDIEVNVNIPIDHTFAQYKQVINFIADSLNKEESIIHYNHGFSFETNAFKLKVYDKKLQSEDKGIKLNEEILRLEITYKDLNKRKNLSSIETVDDLINGGGLLKLKEEFLRDINKLIYKSVMEVLNQQYKNCIRWIREGKQSSITTKISQPLLKGNDILDIILLIEALRETENPKNYAKMYKKATEMALSTDNPQCLFGNLRKLNELFFKIGFEIYKPNLTRQAEAHMKEIEESLLSE